VCRAGGNIARGALLTLLLAPLVVVLDRLDAVGELTLFVLAGAALIPLSWLIGEATAAGPPADRVASAGTGTTQRRASRPPASGFCPGGRCELRAVMMRCAGGGR